jgi:hypothetical protein
MPGQKIQVPGKAREGPDPIDLVNMRQRHIRYGMVKGAEEVLPGQFDQAGLRDPSAGNA